MYEFTLKGSLNADIQSIYQAFVNPTLIKKWCAPNNLVATQFVGQVLPGEHFRLHLESEDGFQQTVFGAYQEVIPNQKISFTWRWEDTNDISMVEVCLENTHNDNTKFLLSQKGFRQKSDMLQQQFAWIDCLENLSLYLPDFPKPVQPDPKTMSSVAA
ncbi:SRPBCC family protein [Glaciecola sp. 1036]|uniref:SRPBCC family protein n=1 Tax=Alteromonadaceae TaxID=72275 RepID=UPI003D05DACD